MRIKTAALLALIGVFAAAFLAAQQPSANLLEEARARRAAGDLQKAVELLESVISNAASDRKTVAGALLEMAGVAESLGQAARARGLYERVRSEFKDQAAEAGIAANRLSAPAGPASAGGTSAGGASKVVIKTPYADDALGFAISPDGRTVVFQGTSPDGKRQLWRQAVDASQKPEPIAGTEGAGLAGARAYPFFSPDGKTLAFFAGKKLWQVDLAGGAAKELADAATPWGGSWSGGGILISGRGTAGGLELVQNGRVTPVTTARGLVTWPKFIDDQQFLYFSRDQRGGGRIEVGSVGGGAVTARGLPPQAHAASFTQGYLLYVTQAGSLNAVRFDPKELAATGANTVVVERVGKEDRLAGVAAFAVSASGAVAYREIAVQKKQMMWMDRTGALVGMLGTPDSASPGSVRLSPDGRTALFFRQTGAAIGSVWVMDTETGAQVQVSDAAPSAMWSPAGDRMIVTALRQGIPSLIESQGTARGVRGAPAAAGRVVSPQGAPAFSEDWAAGGAILYRQGDGGGGGGGGDLFVLPSTNPGAPAPVPVATSPATERNARFSPDGNWIAYQSDEGGRNEVYVQPFPGTQAQRQRVSLGGGVSPQWGRKGRELYFISADNRLMVVSADATLNEGKRNIEFGNPKPLFPSPLPQGAEYDTGSDGDRFLILAPVEDFPPIIVLNNWIPGK